MTEPDLDPVKIEEMRDEARRDLQHGDAKDLMLEAAVNSRIAVRILYRDQLPRLRRLENRAQVFIGVLTVAAVIGPIVAAIISGA